MSNDNKDFGYDTTTRAKIAANSKRRACKFCSDKALYLDYKNVGLIKNFITERGKIVPRRISGTCLKHQRKLSLAVKQARNIALIPFVMNASST